jgi:hypothetical protein
MRVNTSGEQEGMTLATVATFPEPITMPSYNGPNSACIAVSLRFMDGGEEACRVFADPSASYIMFDVRAAFFSFKPILEALQVGYAMCIYVYIYTHTCIHIYKAALVGQLHTHIRTHMHAQPLPYTHTHTHTYTYMSDMNVQPHHTLVSSSTQQSAASAEQYMHTYIYTLTYIHTDVQSHYTLVSSSTQQRAASAEHYMHTYIYTLTYIHTHIRAYQKLDLANLSPVLSSLALSREPLQPKIPPYLLECPFLDFTCIIKENCPADIRYFLIWYMLCMCVCLCVIVCMCVHVWMYVACIYICVYVHEYPITVRARGTQASSAFPAPHQPSLKATVRFIQTICALCVYPCRCIYMQTWTYNHRKPTTHIITQSHNQIHTNPFIHLYV